MKWIPQEKWKVSSSLNVEDLRIELARNIEAPKVLGLYFTSDKVMEGKVMKNGFSIRKMTTGRNACSIRIYGQIEEGKKDSSSLKVKFALDTIILISLIYGLGFVLTFFGLIGLGVLLSEGEFLLVLIALGIGSSFAYFSSFVFRSEMQKSQEAMKTLLDLVHHEKGKYEVTEGDF